MKRYIFILFLTVSILLSACASTPAPFKNIPVTSTTGTAAVDLSRTDSQGSVTVKITPLNMDKPGDTLKFDVALNTHSVDLSMDLATLATLTTDTGITLKPVTWDAPKGGHHADGTLSFPATKDGKSILDGAKQLILTITNIDNATRIFTWDLSAK